MTRALTIVLATLLGATAAVAQEHDAHAVGDHGPAATSAGMPDGWLMRLDRTDASAEMSDFQVMAPGWHVKTGRAGAGIYWMEGMAGSGEYEARASYHLFSPASHPEAFGLFIGGERLGVAEQEYLYFLVRQTGEYLIKRRAGSETENVVGWTRHDAVPVAPAEEQGPTRYDLAVDVGVDTVRFMVNGSTVHALPRSELDTEGVVGLRINHMLDVHVEEMALEKGG
jgi:hypothetical protein